MQTVYLIIWSQGRTIAESGFMLHTAQVFTTYEQARDSVLLSFSKSPGTVVEIGEQDRRGVAKIVVASKLEGGIIEQGVIAELPLMDKVNHL